MKNSVFGLGFLFGLLFYGLIFAFFASSEKVAHFLAFFVASFFTLHHVGAVTDFGGLFAVIILTAFGSGFAFYSLKLLAHFGALSTFSEFAMNEFIIFFTRAGFKNSCARSAGGVVAGGVILAFSLLFDLAILAAFDIYVDAVARPTTRRFVAAGFVFVSAVVTM